MKQDVTQKEPGCSLALSDSRDGIGNFKITGVMNFDSVISLDLRADELFPNYNSVTIDLSGVTYVNSAGLALLLEWKRKAVLANRTIKTLNAPKKLLNIARISEIETILSF